LAGFDGSYVASHTTADDDEVFLLYIKVSQSTSWYNNIVAHQPG
jgi:hypothetical protein